MKQLSCKSTRAGRGGPEYAARVILYLWLGCTPMLALAENWEGIEQGGLCRNATQSTVAPAGLSVVWQRTFPVSKVKGKNEFDDPVNDEMRLSCGRGSRNLTLVDGMIALVATDKSTGDDGYHCTVIDADDGTTRNWIRVRSSIGNHRAYKWPYYCVSMSHDNITGIVNTHWDAESKVFFLGQGAYNSSYTAYRPLANISSYTGSAQPGEPAFEQLAGNHGSFQDAFGNTRSAHKTVFGPNDFISGMRPYTWGLAAAITQPDVNKGKFDIDWQEVFPQSMGSSYYNTSSYFVVDAGGELIGNVRGYANGHSTAGDLYLFNKHTGMKAITAMPEMDGKRLFPFTSQGAIIGNGRVFCAGAADGKRGTDRPEGRVPKMDQGLYLWAYDYSVDDTKSNGGYSGKGSNETATLEPAFVHRFESRFTPDENDIESYGQSYYECDGFYRNKAMIIDGKSPWFAWKPSQDDAVELIHADDNGAQTYSLNVGQGAKGVDLWPKMSLTEVGGRKYIVYFTGYARHRKRFIPEDPIQALRQVREDAGLPPVSTEVENEVANHATKPSWNGMWTGKFFPPRCHAALAVFDVADKKVVYAYDISQNHPDIPSNEFWTQVDKTQMVTTGTWAHVAWVDTTAADARLKILSFDITESNAGPVVSHVRLGFGSADNARSALFDLIAADSRLYALVTQSARLWIRDPRWKAQHVIAIEGDGSGVGKQPTKTPAPAMHGRIDTKRRSLRITSPTEGRLIVQQFCLDGRRMAVPHETHVRNDESRNIPLAGPSRARGVSVVQIDHASSRKVIKHCIVKP